MEKRLVSNKEFDTLGSIPEGIGLVAIKFVSIGPNKQSELERSTSKICDFVGQQPTFFIINQSDDTFRAVLHEYVDRFCNAVEGKS